MRPVTNAADNPPSRTDQPSHRVTAIFAILLSSVIFGSAAVPAKKALEHFPPFVLAELRWIVALGVILGLLKRRGERPVVTRTTWLLGLTGLALFYLFYSYGLRHTTAANATLIAGGTPVLVAILSSVFLGERIGPRKAIGIAASLVGVAIIVGGATGLGATLRGNLLIVGSGTSWSIYTVLGRRAFSTGSSLAMLAGTAIAAMVIMAPLAGIELVRDGIDTSRPTDWLLVLYLALGPSALAYVLIGYGLTHVEASLAAVFGNVMPLSGAIAGWLLLDEQLGWAHLIGGGCIVLGVWIATTGGRLRLRPVALRLAERREVARDASLGSSREAG